jgi:hypothetical protein
MVGKRPLRRQISKWMDNNKMDLGERSEIVLSESFWLKIGAHRNFL